MSIFTLCANAVDLNGQEKFNEKIVESKKFYDLIEGGSVLQWDVAQTVLGSPSIIVSDEAFFFQPDVDVLLKERGRQLSSSEISKVFSARESIVITLSKNHETVIKVSLKNKNGDNVPFNAAP